MVHRAAEFLDDLEAADGRNGHIEKDILNKCVKVNGVKAGFSFCAEWRWTRWAIDRYTETERSDGKAFAEDE